MQPHAFVDRLSAVVSNKAVASNKRNDVRFDIFTFALLHSKLKLPISRFHYIKKVSVALIIKHSVWEYISCIRV